jgi:ribonuclease BN (tRNA processing enzyme)
MEIRVLGAHNCESADTRLTSLLIDDRLVIDAGGLTSGLSLEAQRQLEGVLLTHHHYDHVRDILALGMNYYLAKKAIKVYTSREACEVITSHLLDGEIYPDFTALPQDRPTIEFTVMEPGRSRKIGGYEVLTVPVNHSIPTVGYQVTSADGKSMFYTGDTGPGLSECWEKISPQLLVVECTVTDDFREFGKKSGHLTPALLKEELIAFGEIRGYLPRVVTVHMSPGLEEGIRRELAEVAGQLNVEITPGHEGMLITL